MAKPKMICRSCGHQGKGKRVTPGNFLVELCLWLTFLIPGIIYTIWRSSNRYRACDSCGGRDLIPLDSPIGLKLAYENAQQLTKKRDPYEEWAESQG